MCLFWKPPYYSIQLSCYNQVLTGVLPYHGSNLEDMITDIRAGKRSSRPMDSSQGRLLEDPVWNVISTGWRGNPRRRCKLSVMHHTFLPQQQRGRILPRVASFFQFLQDLQPETQKRVDEMNEVCLSTLPPTPA